MGGPQKGHRCEKPGPIAVQSGARAKQPNLEAQSGSVISQQNPSEPQVPGILPTALRQSGISMNVLALKSTHRTNAALKFLQKTVQEFLAVSQFQRVFQPGKSFIMLHMPSFQTIKLFGRVVGFGRALMAHVPRFPARSIRRLDGRCRWLQSACDVAGRELSRGGWLERRYRSFLK